MAKMTAAEKKQANELAAIQDVFVVKGKGPAKVDPSHHTLLDPPKKTTTGGG